MDFWKTSTQLREMTVKELDAYREAAKLIGKVNQDALIISKSGLKDAKAAKGTRKAPTPAKHRAMKDERVQLIKEYNIICSSLTNVNNEIKQRNVGAYTKVASTTHATMIRVEAKLDKILQLLEAGAS